VQIVRRDRRMTPGAAAHQCSEIGGSGNSRHLWRTPPAASPPGLEPFSEMQQSRGVRSPGWSERQGLCPATAGCC
jgi:hypothetical protein